MKQSGFLALILLQILFLVALYFQAQFDQKILRSVTGRVFINLKHPKIRETHILFVGRQNPSSREINAKIMQDMVRAEFSTSHSGVSFKKIQANLGMERESLFDAKHLKILEEFKKYELAVPPSLGERFKHPVSEADYYLSWMTLLRLYRLRQLVRNESSVKSWRFLVEIICRQLRPGEFYEFMGRRPLEIFFPKYRLEFLRNLCREQKLDLSYVLALILSESGFHQGALSRAGACGLMQILPETAATVQKRLPANWRQSLREFQPSCVELQANSKANLVLGTHYLKELLTRYNGNYEMSLAAYNAGPGRVKRWKRKAGPFLGNVEFEETRNYILRVSRRAWYYQELMRM